MTSCEAVAVAQRTTVVGAALGLTVYLASGGVSSASSVAAGGAGCGGGGGGGPVERSGGSGSGGGSGAELRALARSAVEALLEVGSS